MRREPHSLARLVEVDGVDDVALVGSADMRPDDGAATRRCVRSAREARPAADPSDPPGVLTGLGKIGDAYPTNGHRHESSFYRFARLRQCSEMTPDEGS